MLIELKAECQHGEFLPNLQRAVNIKQAMAYNLMTLARNLPLLEEKKPESHFRYCVTRRPDTRKAGHALALDLENRLTSALTSWIFKIHLHLLLHRKPKGKAHYVLSSRLSICGLEARPRVELG